jgi:hypothetical protein
MATNHLQRRLDLVLQGVDLLHLQRRVFSHGIEAASTADLRLVQRELDKFTDALERRGTANDVLFACTNRAQSEFIERTIALRERPS